MKTYLITGCAGFIGSNFVHYMLKKYPEILLVNLDTPRPLERSCMVRMESIMRVPFSRVPSLWKIPEIAQPAGMRTCPSFCNMVLPPYILR